MKCPNCGAPAKSSEVFCSACGQSMELSIDDITSQVGSDVAQSQARETEEQMRQYLIWGVSLFLVAWIYHSAFADHPAADPVPRMSVGWEAEQAEGGPAGWTDRRFEPYATGSPVPEVLLPLPDMDGAPDGPRSTLDLRLRVDNVVNALGEPMALPPRPGEDGGDGDGD